MKIFDHLFFRRKHTCPWWLCFTFDNFARRLFQNPEKILRPYIAEGITVLDVGPGMGYFSIPLASIVGPSGRVVAADIQPEMLNALEGRAKRAGVDQNITLHLCKTNSLGLNVKVDFALAFWMLHEVPDPLSFFKEMRTLLKASGRLLISEPIIHVPPKMFSKNIEIALAHDFKLIGKPKIFLSRSVLLEVSK